MRILQKSIRLSVAFALGGISALLPQFASAIDVDNAVRQAILNNPEVLAKLHQFRGAGQDVNEGRAGYMPTVDLTYESNRQTYDYPSNAGVANQKYTTRGWKLSLNQNLFQGLQTYNTVKQLGYDQQVRYFELLDTSESMALQTVQAYQDVLRYRQLVNTAQENYAIHKGIYQQIEQKVQAGVGRRVDLEQAAGRLALAESNLLTDTSNLHDVSARYARLTGSEPSAQLNELPALTEALPRNNELIKNAVLHNPAYLGSLASIRSAAAEVNARRGAFSPTLDLQASKAPTDNYDGYTGRTNMSSVAVIFNMNLFRGGADRARLGSSSEKLNTTKDLRDKVCRDMRQTLSIANNNIIKIKQQMASLRQHELSTEKARDAYRKQFDIGQRTLLDVLDSENELFDAQRAYINAQSDYKVAEATVLGNSGRLLETLRLKPVEEFQTDSSLSEEEQNACNTSYTAPTLIDVQTIQPKQYVAATAEPVATPVVAPVPAEPVKAAPQKKTKKSKKLDASAAG